MTDSQRLTYLKIAAISVVGLFLLDRLVISPAINHWNAQSERIDALRQKVERGQQMIDREDAIRGRWAEMVKANLPAEVSAAEFAAYQAISRWAGVSGISLASLAQEWQNHDEGYQTLEFRASATGTQAALGRFIYELETDKLPVNLDEYEITTRDDRGAVLTMTARFSFLRMNITGGGAPMRISPAVLILAAVCAPLGCVSPGQGAAPGQSFDTYRMIRMRNIFDPERQGDSTQVVERPRVVEAPPRATDFVTLTGVMVDSGRALAFFYGSRPDYDKVTEVNGEIAGATVTRVTAEGIEVDRGGKKINVAVGQTVPFDNSAPGAPPAGVIAAGSAPPAATTGTGAPPATDNPLPGNLNDVMRRMMERRQQELQ